MQDLTNEVSVIKAVTASSPLADFQVFRGSAPL
jgi:hypothetical protein